MTYRISLFVLFLGCSATIPESETTLRSQTSKESEFLVLGGKRMSNRSKKESPIELKKIWEIYLEVIQDEIPEYSDDEDPISRFSFLRNEHLPWKRLILRAVEKIRSHSKGSSSEDSLPATLLIMEFRERLRVGVATLPGLPSSESPHLYEPFILDEEVVKADTRKCVEDARELGGRLLFWASHCRSRQSSHLEWIRSIPPTATYQPKDSVRDFVAGALNGEESDETVMDVWKGRAAPTTPPKYTGEVHDPFPPSP